MNVTLTTKGMNCTEFAVYKPDAVKELYKACVRDLRGKVYKAGSPEENIRFEWTASCRLL